MTGPLFGCKSALPVSPSNAITARRQSLALGATQRFIARCFHSGYLSPRRRRIVVGGESEQLYQGKSGSVNILIPTPRISHKTLEGSLYESRPRRRADISLIKTPPVRRAKEKD